MKQEQCYKGNASNYQINNGERKRPLDSVVIKYSKYQNFLYKRAMYGIKVCSPESVSKMSPEEITRINKNHKKALNVINVHKQIKMIAVSNDLLTSIFWKHLGPSEGLLTPAGTKWDQNYKVSLTCKQLNISKDEIINVLMSRGVLPKDYYELNLK